MGLFLSRTGLDMNTVKNETDKICYVGRVRMLAGGSLQRMSGDADVLTPILDALPHLKLAVPGRLDCNVSGSSLGAHSSFVVRQDESVAPLSVEMRHLISTSP